MHIKILFQETTTTMTLVYELFCNQVRVLTNFLYLHLGCNYLTFFFTLDLFSIFTLTGLIIDDDMSVRRKQEKIVELEVITLINGIKCSNLKMLSAVIFNDFFVAG